MKPIERCKALIARDREVLSPATRISYFPLAVSRAEGSKVWDLDGNEYLDGTASLWCNVHGHRHPRLDAAIRRQLDRVAHVTALGASNPTTIKLAKRLVALAPPGLGHVFFSDDGATAVEVAVKMALQYWWNQERERFGIVFWLLERFLWFPRFA